MPADEMVCTLCGQASLTPMFRAPAFDSPQETFDVVRCKHCQVAATRPRLSAERLLAYYDTRYYGSGDTERPSQQKFVPWIEQLLRIKDRRRGERMLRWVAAGARPPGAIRILDVGCGRGGFLQALSHRGYACTGIDIGDFPEAHPGGFTFRRGALEEQQFATASFDAVSIWHVLEHLPDPVKTLQEVARVMKAGGVLSLAVPNIDSTQARLFGPLWFHLDLPRHLYHFNAASLRALLAAVGFKVLHTQTLSWAQNTYGWLQSMQNRLLPRAQMNRLYALLKRRQGRAAVAPQDRLAFAALGSLAVASLPLALAETVGSAACGRGASLVMHAQRTGLPPG